ncbi:hypothetical protein DMA11_02900 [Marinilabiliaceae bacterium JC017]|nr:hypothetical protein DMA11_02900 [Marinilabiliaceae bacterium JC017]
MNRLLWTFTILGLILIFNHCSSDDMCLSYQHSMEVRLYSSTSKTDKDTALIGLEIIGVGQDSAWTTDTFGQNKFFLPLNFNTDTTSWVFKHKTRRDTIDVIYRKELNFVSGNCGFSQDITIDTITHSISFIDSIDVAYPSIKYGENVENVKIYIY